MNRRNFFRGATASLFAFVGAKFLPIEKSKTFWDGTRVPHSFHAGWKYNFIYGRDRVSEGIINTRLDELAIGINPIYVHRKSITEQAFEEVQASDIRVYSNTRKCDLNSLKNEDYT